MFLCKVIGTVISQQKEDCLIGKKLLLCETKDSVDRRQIVAIDMVGAGQGSEVLVSRQYQGDRQDYIDDRIVAIVDSVSGQQ